MIWADVPLCGKLAVCLLRTVIKVTSISRKMTGFEFHLNLCIHMSKKLDLLTNITVSSSIKTITNTANRRCTGTLAACEPLSLNPHLYQMPLFCISAPELRLRS